MLPKDYKTNILTPCLVWAVISVLITIGVMSMFEPSNYSIVLFVALLAAVFGIPVLIYMECRTIINDYFDGKKRKQVKEREVPEHPVEFACPVENTERKTEPTTIINNVVVQVANSSTNVVCAEAHAESKSEATPTTIIEGDSTYAEPAAEEDNATTQTPTNWPSLLTDRKALVLLDGLVKENLLAEGYKKKGGTEATQLAYMLGTIYEILNINPRWKEFELFWSVKNLRQTFNQTFSRGTVVKNQYAIKLAIQKAADSDTAIKNMDKYIKWRKENAVD
ncbi:MAG: hypothetical protein KHX42_04480 [Prevotella sp.]|nr:hypothetical protein [Prevotella sp.]